MFVNKVALYIYLYLEHTNSITTENMYPYKLNTPSSTFLFSGYHTDLYTTFRVHGPFHDTYIIYIIRS